MRLCFKIVSGQSQEGNMIVALLQQEKTKGCSIFAARFKVNVVFVFCPHSLLLQS